jgi:hypothetical protein
MSKDYIKVFKTFSYKVTNISDRILSIQDNGMDINIKIWNHYFLLHLLKLY